MKRIIICLICVALLLSGVCALAEPLKRGDKGDEVVALQLKLIEHNYLLDGADGDFGGKTEKAVKQLQADAGLEQTGIADDATLNALEHYTARFEPTKDSDMLFYSLECDPDVMHMLTIHVKNTGRQRITGLKFNMYECNASKTSLGSFYGNRNSSTKRKRTENWSTHSASVDIPSGEDDVCIIVLEEGFEVTFSDGSTQTVTWYDKGVYARVAMTEFTTEDGKTHKVDQKLYAKFR